MTSSQEPTVVRLDLFPAKVLLIAEDGTSRELQSVRAIVTADRFYAFQDAAGGPVEAYSSRLVDASGSSTAGWTLELADESRAVVNRQGGCGCGSLLRGFRPFYDTVAGASL